MNLDVGQEGRRMGCYLVYDTEGSPQTCSGVVMAGLINFMLHLHVTDTFTPLTAGGQWPTVGPLLAELVVHWPFAHWFLGGTLVS